MYFERIQHSANFTFCTGRNVSGKLVLDDGRQFRPLVDELGGDVFRLRISPLRGPRWKNPSQAELEISIPGDNRCTADFKADGTFEIHSDEWGDVTLLSGLPGATFGVCGTAWMLQFAYAPNMRFYGLGENCRNFEKTGQRVKFWNTDVWADYPISEVINGGPALLYVSIPWLIVRCGGAWIGILVNHSGAVFMDLASNFVWDEKNRDDRTRGSFYFGAPDGWPDVYFIVGPSLPELTRKMQTLVGRTPLPPLWALGYHQCRWGYAGPDDLRDLDHNFTKYGIPADGLWLDIDYMDRYKVFTFNPKLWGGRDAVRRVLDELRDKGRRVVPILDPGVKVERGYDVYDDGIAKNVFCRNPEGKPFVGFVWPGMTNLPDFSLENARAWWAEKVMRFANEGVSGVWLDMNDPSVGAVELFDMLFDRGRKPHETYHNQYALGMAKASKEGFLKSRPDERPFLLSRSAFISSSRYTAVWTGDNYSNRLHLRMSVPVTLNLALSGIPFNGPDVPGFGGDATPEVARDWFKCGFLFPFFRNHSICESRRQEPWAFDEATREVLAHYIRLRYKLLPYLYQLWIEQEEIGEAVMRPLFYDFDDSPGLSLERIADQFMIGPSLMQAPVLDEMTMSREVVLPMQENGGKWFSAMDGHWHEGGRRIHVKTDSFSTPLFVREGALIPMLRGERTSQKSDLDDIELHCFLRRDSKETFRTTYAFDDGETFAYKRGERTSAIIDVSVCDDGDTLQVIVSDLRENYRKLHLRIVVFDTFHSVNVEIAGRVHKCVPERWTWRFCGIPIVCFTAHVIR